MSKDYDLTKEEKAALVIANLKNLSTQKYKLELSLFEENSSSQPDQSFIDGVSDNIENVNLKITALENKLVEVLGG